MYPEKVAYQCATHIAPTINRWTRNEVIEDCVKVLQQFDYDTLAFQGASGIGISLILAHLLQKEVILVRKEGEPRNAYARYKVEGYREAKRYIIVDDLIATGSTAARVLRGVRDLAPSAELVGILLYYEGVQIITATSDFDQTWHHVHRMAACQDHREKKEKEKKSCDATIAMGAELSRWTAESAEETEQTSAMNAAAAGK